MRWVALLIILNFGIPVRERAKYLGVQVGRGVALNLAELAQSRGLAQPFSASRPLGSAMHWGHDWARELFIGLSAYHRWTLSGCRALCPRWFNFNLIPVGYNVLLGFLGRAFA
eukprot:4900065-Amphidinium_carterae.1